MIKDAPVRQTEDIELIHEIGRRIAVADPLHEVLQRVIDFIVAVVKCDSCFVYVLEGNELVLRASKNPHQEVVDRLKLNLGQGIAGWVAERKVPVAVARDASKDPRFRFFAELPEDCFQALLSVPLLCRDKVVGVINLQHRQPHVHSEREIQLVGTIGFLVGAEMELARLEVDNSELSERLETRKRIERAKGILQRDLGVTEEEAYRALQAHSRQHRKSMRDIADAILLTEEVKRPASE
jgi:uroporphyrinogen-III synthase